jgi:hypothetical protein
MLFCVLHKLTVVHQQESTGVVNASALKAAFCYNKFLRFGTVLVIMRGAVSGIADAQAPTASDSGGESQELDEFIATAEKRESTAQKTPISITALTGGALEARGISDVLHLAEESASPGQTDFEMRGLSSSGGVAATVGFYLDDIPLSVPAIGSIGKDVNWERLQNARVRNTVAHTCDYQPAAVGRSQINLQVLVLHS